MFGKRQSTNALDLPPIAQSEPSAQEVLRVWAMPGQPQQLTLRTIWNDPGAWGLLLADVARHAANAYANEGRDPKVVLARIRELFDAEMFDPTDVVEEIS